MVRQANSSSKSSASVESKPQGKVTTEVITPDVAAALLEKNTRNFRKLSEGRARQLAEVMSRGHFKFNGTSVVSIRDDGSIRDGQTRLRASVISGTPFRTLVYRGPVEEEADIDTGSKRTAGQVLQYHNVSNANSVAAAVKAFMAIFEKKTVSHLSYSAPIATSEVKEWHDGHPQMDDSVRKAAESPTGLYQALVAAIHYAGMGLDQAHTEWWIKGLTTGEGLSENDPVLRLRNRFLNSSKRVMMSRIEQAALLIKSWNLSREGKAVKALQWRGSGPNPEPFPELGEVSDAPADAPGQGAAIATKILHAPTPAAARALVESVTPKSGGHNNRMARDHHVSA